MARKEEKFFGPRKLVNHDTYHDAILAKAGKLERVTDENDQIDVDYINFLRYILAQEEKSVCPKKRKEIIDDHDIDENDDCIGEENDPWYKLFLKDLKTHGKSYVLEYKKHGLPVVIKYEGDSGLDEECDPQHNRRLRSATKKEYELPIQMPAMENQHKHDLKSTSVKMTKNCVEEKSRYDIKKQKVEKLEDDTEYLTFIQSSKLVGDYFVGKFGSNTVVYENNHRENNQEKENHDSEYSSSDVEILESTSFRNEGNLNSSAATSTEMNKDSFQNPDPTMQSKFRQQLINLLKKPYDKEEYHRLWHDIKVHTPEVRHMDLRGGRQLSYSTSKAGRSYLDRFTALKRCLSKIDDRPKRLNLLRGFFFWLQKSPLEGSFMPWIDEQCLAISPESQCPEFPLKGDEKLREMKCRSMKET